MEFRSYFNLPESHYQWRTIVAWLWHIGKGNRLQASINAALGLMEVGTSLLMVWTMQHAIDVASGDSHSSTLLMAVCFIGAVFVANLALRIAGVWVRNILGVKAQNRLQQEMLRRILHSEWQGREAHHSGDVLNRLEQDVVKVVEFLTETLPDVVYTLTLFTGAFCYMYAMDHALAFIIVAIVPMFALLSKLYIRKMRQLTRQVRDSDSEVQSMLQESVQQRMVIKTLEAEDYTVGRLEKTHRRLRGNVIRRTVFSVFSNMMLSFGFMAGYLIAFLWAALRLAAGTLTFGGMTAFLQLVSRIQTPARNLTRLAPAFVGVFTAAERLMELEETPEEEKGDEQRVAAPCGLQFDDVSFAYADEKKKNIINHLSFNFPPGSCTAILGETGAGKTTLLRLLLALLKPTSGQVYIYNKVGTRQPLNHHHRCNIAFVPQGNTLMSGTIRDNLLLGMHNATDEEMLSALRTSCAGFVEQLPLGLDTLCNEHGGGLSEGQAQRIAIARALLRNRPILILDEATSALDPETERNLLHNLLANRDKTIIFVTHRPAVIDYCDQTLTQKAPPQEGAKIQ